MNGIIYLKNVIRNLQFLVTHRITVEEENLIYRIKDEVLEDVVFQYKEDDVILKKIHICDEDETIQLLKTSPKSFCRMGDGEINLMKGKDQPFQQYDSQLVQKLMRILEDEQKDMYVGINRAYFHSVLHWGEENRRYYRLYGTEFRRFFIEHCNPNNNYIDAGFTTAYFRYKTDYDYEGHYKKMKELFQGKNIFIVSGEGVLEKLEFDVFELAECKTILHGPSKNAYDKYNEILGEIKRKANKKQIICFILGMAGKAMIKELTDQGYIAWDIGHMAKDYDAYMKGIEKNHVNTRNFYAPD